MLIPLVLAITSPVLAAQNGPSVKSQLVVEPELRQIRYCSNKPGVLTLDVEVLLKYKNVGQTTVILPKLIQSKRHSFFSSADALRENRPSNGRRSSPTEFFDLSKLDLTKPDQTIFHIIERGGSGTNLLYVMVLLRHPRLQVPKESLLGKDTYLVVEINHWFGSRKLAGEFQRRWQEFGELWIEDLWAPPLRLPLESNPVVQSCNASID